MPRRDETSRTIDEIVALYELEPSVKDVYVEGRKDQTLISYYFASHCPLSTIVVREISDVNIPFEDFKHLHSEDNNRGRVIALACLLEEKCKVDIVHRVTCIVDADFAYLYNITFSAKLLAVTDYTSIELYAFNVEVIRKFCLVILNCPCLNPEFILNAIQDTLVELFLVRATNQSLGWGLENLSLKNKGLCKIKGDVVEFHTSEYIKRFLINGNCWPRRIDFNSKLQEIRNRLPTDKRYKIHGHDFVEVLHWYMRETKSIKNIDPDFFRGALMSCIETVELDKENLFQTLLQRLCGSAG